MPDNATAIYSLKPSFHIDQVLHEGMNADLLELVIEESLSSPARCLARFNNMEADPNGGPAYKYFGLSDFDFGSDLAIWLGVPPSTLYRLFEGRVNMIEAGYDRHERPEILVQAEDGFQEMKMRVRSRVFEELTDADIIQQIADEYGLATEMNLDGTAPIHKHLTQLNQSDYAFLAERARWAGANMRISHNTLIVSQTGALALEPFELTYGENLTRFRVRADLRDQCTVMGVSGWDMRNKQTLMQSSSEDDLPADGTGQDGGGRTLEAAFGQSLANVVDAGPRTVDEAEHLARTYYREKARKFITGEGVCSESWEIRVGRAVTLKNAGTLFDGAYTVTALRHRYDHAHGMRTEFEVERSYIGETEKNHKEKKHARNPERSKPTRKPRSEHKRAPQREKPRAARNPRR